jgi:hypothetical protein
MPSTEQVPKSELAGTVDDFLRQKRSGKFSDPNNPDFLSIIEFIEKFDLLPNGLYPTQRFILKLYYNIPLDDILPSDPNDRIRITDKFNTKVVCEFTETEYLNYLYDQGRCNIKKQDERERRELILVLGRRSGKSLLSALIAAYELYKLLRRGCPQEYYGMQPTSQIRIICVANDKEQAEIVYGDMSAFVTQIDYFKSSIVHDTQSFQKFQTEHDRKKFGTGKRGSITATFKSSIAKGLRGRGIVTCILDELAFFVDDGKSSAKRVYKAIFPSTAQFSPKDPKNRRVPIGPNEGRMISISSPDAREGFFYELYQIALSKDKAAANMLMIQAPTWEVNPTIDSDYYRTEHAKDPLSFNTEYGARFSDRVRGWIEDPKDLTECINEDLRPINRGIPRDPHWVGLDFGIVKDGTSVTLTHLSNGKVEVDYHESWYAGKRWSEINPHLTNPIVSYAHTLQDVNRLDIDEIVNWLTALSRRFFILKGVFDQWAGPIFEQKLHKSGLIQFEMRNFTTAESSQTYSITKMLMYSRQLSIYDYPIPEAALDGTDLNKHSPHITELLELQAYSGGKNIVVVEAPKIIGKHDDFSDSFARSCMLAAEHIKENPNALDMSFHLQSIKPNMTKKIGYGQFHRHRARLHGPPPRERTIPRVLKRG